MRNDTGADGRRAVVKPHRSEVPAYLPRRGELRLVGHQAVLFGGQPHSAGLSGLTSRTLLDCLASVKKDSAGSRRLNTRMMARQFLSPPPAATREITRKAGQENGR